MLQRKTCIFFLLVCIWNVLAIALPDGVKFEPFYDFEKASFVKNKIKTIWMDEVPGLPQHFWVMGWFGTIHTLYPDDYDPKSLVPNTSLNYTRKEIANFKDKVHPSIYSEYGTWSIAFHKKFTENGLFYVMYMGKNPGQTKLSRKSGGLVKIDEWKATGPKYEIVKFQRVLFKYKHKASFGVGCMIMGPDGNLWISNCDYGTNSYDLSILGRKILRINPDTKENGLEYGIPKDNPFANSSDPKKRKEIWAWGIRNIWGMHFDEITGDLWTGEIGQSIWEELNIIKKGTNGGWREGGDGEKSKYGGGYSGPCADGKLASSRSGSRNCAEFEPPFWSFPRKGGTVTGTIGNTGNYISMASILAGKTFMGAKDSPFYGYHIFGDTHDGEIYATKSANRATYTFEDGKFTIGGTPPALIGQSDGSISKNRDGHDGFCYFGRDKFGYIYAAYVDWHRGVDYREIYRLTHPDMKPAIAGCTDSLATGYDPKAGIHDPAKCSGVSKNKIPVLKKKWGQPVMVANTIRGLGRVTVPRGAYGVKVCDVKGKIVWHHTRTDISNEESISLPKNTPSGLLRVRALFE